MHDGLDPKLLRYGVECLVKYRNGWPRFSGDKALVAGFMRNGFDERLARRRIAVGCNWMSLPGLEYTMNDLVKVNLAKVFEVAYDESKADAGRTTERLWRSFASHLREAVRTAAEGIRHHLKYQKFNEPELLLNLLSHGPIEKGRDVSDGGAEYYNLAIDGAGLAVVADSFAALEQRIEREGRLTWQEMDRLLDSDFQCEEGTKYRTLLGRSQRYGRPIRWSQVGACRPRRVHGGRAGRDLGRRTLQVHSRFLLVGQYRRVRTPCGGDSQRPAGRNAHFARSESLRGVRRGRCVAFAGDGRRRDTARLRKYGADAVGA